MQGSGNVAGNFNEHYCCGPFVLLDTEPLADCNEGSIRGGDPEIDLLVAIRTVANDSSGPHEKVGGIVFVSDIRDWIDQIISLEVLPQQNILLD